MTDHKHQLPDGPLLTYYGDDFTGSTDVMEAFTASGISTVLFLQIPRKEDLARFKEMRCFGLAGQSRGQTPEWMRQELPAIFKSLAAIGAPLLQYKVCSTFDSSPSVGSIGCAIEIGTKITQGQWSPMVVGAPRLKRYQVFGQLFAAVDGVSYRIDRHPTMSRHPVTPMDEADLRLHLAKQTNKRISLVDIADMSEGLGQAKLDESLMQTDQPVVMIDIADRATQIEAGRLIWENKGRQVFSASSSGLQYALTAYWKTQGLIPAATSLPTAKSVDTIAVVSGSCSPMSAEQIRWARKNGFDVSRLDISKILQDDTMESEIARHADRAIDALARSISSLVFSAEGPDDRAVVQFDALVSRASLDRAQAAKKIGFALAEIMRRILDGSNVKRVVVAGGDSSGAVGSHLGIRALTLSAALAPGVPLCRAWSDAPDRDGLEIALKGGQLGSVSFYGHVRAGQAL
jgi:uncharacterized protein YgbK (DUF1537 family)